MDNFHSWFKWEVKGFPPLQGNKTLEVQDLSQLPSTVDCSF